jgi:PAS domain S-box-containing protein
MIQCSIGHAEGIDPVQLTEKVISDCQSQLGSNQAQAGILYTSIAPGQETILAQIRNAFPDTDIVGCTTAGEFSSKIAFSEDSISLMLFSSDRVEFGCGIGTGLSHNPKKAVMDAVKMSRRHLTQPVRACLTMPGAHDKPFDQIISAFHEGFGNTVPILGGLAGFQAIPQDRALQYYNDQVLVDAIPVLSIAGPIVVRFAIANAWKPVGNAVRVTSAKGEEVLEIDHRPAMDFLSSYLGEHDAPILDFPLAIHDDTTRQFYIRPPRQYNHDLGSVIFTESIKEGSIVQLTAASRNYMLENARKSIASLVSRIEEPHIYAVLGFSCSLRKEVMGTMGSSETRLIRQALPPDTPVSGFYAFGEIAPLTAESTPFIHGGTLITVAMTGDDPPPVSVKPYKAFAGANNDEGITTKDPEIETSFLERRLKRANYYRANLEMNKEFNTSLHTQILEEVNAARKKLEEKEAALKISEEKYRRIVETAGEGFVLMDKDLNIIDANDSFLRLLGYHQDELVGKTPMDLTDDASRNFMMLNLEELLATDYREFEITLIAKDGHSVPIWYYGSTLRNDAGEQIGNMAFVHDMTEHKKSLALAEEVQKSLMPEEAPGFPGLDVAGRNVSCDEIGGDYFDFIWRQDGRNKPFSIVVGDITGHGVDAALFMTTARAFLRMRAAQPGGVSEIVSEMNRHLAKDVIETGRFMTLFFLTVDPHAGTAEWVRAGHDPAMLYDSETDQFHELKGSGMALGVDPEAIYPLNRFEGIQNRWIITIGTDGVWEARNRQGAFFGKDRLKSIIRENKHATAHDILEAVYKDWADFSQGVKSEDDATLVVIKITI